MSAKIKVTVTSEDMLYYKVLSLIKNSQAIADSINRQIAPILYKKAKSICMEAVDAYYASYSPHLYNRTESLYDAYDIGIRNGTELVFLVGADLMSGSHRVSNEYIYNTMFEEGWHGGAKSGDGHPNPGTPYWRTPSSPRNMYFEEIDEVLYVHSWALWYKSPAPKSESPFDTIVSQWNGYLDGEFAGIKADIIEAVLREYLNL